MNSPTRVSSRAGSCTDWEARHIETHAGAGLQPATKRSETDQMLEPTANIFHNTCY